MRTDQKPRPAVPFVLVALCVVGILVFGSLALQIGKQIDAKQHAAATQQQQRAATKAIRDETAGARALGHDL